ncbi:hypothetical protein FH972_026722 [Carpinus fangiana]|uniref:Impact N-terminal domain-containing protein n=1 Tax=Carpinus fangiana TaxID=176857 RepID=A0A5N6L4U5_9ROSI|nr:hypothetical protein FH972_026722 [Carpinus fangiana]
MSRKRPAPDAQPAVSSADADVYLSPPIHDRSSTFVAAFSPVRSRRDLQSLPDFADASHRIAAWRVASKQRSIVPDGRKHYDTGHDDDGEAYAGKRAERVLEAMNVEGNLVVARWYGGVLLGPVRFTHIESCAKRAIIIYQETTRTAAEPQDSEAEHRKRTKLDQDTKARQAKLSEVLAQRDESIASLRGLLAEKMGKSPAAQKPATADYARMPLETLKRLEDARDRTISFLLKQIDIAEATTVAQATSADAAEKPAADEKSVQDELAAPQKPQIEAPEVEGSIDSPND